MSATVDPSGLYGTVMHYALTIAIVGSSMIYFVYLWHKGRLDMDEEPKWQMLNPDRPQTDEEPHDR